MARGPHVILLHQHSDAEADERIALLERVITGYHLLFAAQGIELSVPRRRLVSAWFADQKGLLWRSSDRKTPTHSPRPEATFIRPGTPWSPTTRAAATRSARLGHKLAAKRDELQRYREHGRPGPGTEPDQDQARRRARRGPLAVLRRTHCLTRIDGEITCETMFLDLDRRSIDLGTAAHEMIHQLASDSGLVPRHDAFPGLAARRVGGPIRGNPRRPMGGHQPCARPATPGLAAAAKPAPSGAPGPQRRLWPRLPTRPVRPGLGAGLFPPHPAPAAVPDVHRLVAQSELGSAESPVSGRGRPRFRCLSAGLRNRHGRSGEANGTGS